MVCCVLTAAILAMIGRFFRRITGRGDTPEPQRPPAPTRIEVTAAVSPASEAVGERVLVGADV